ncbi:MAG: hypothetical protein ACKO37_00425 [Vampirovibrionales bacterium]
MPSPLRTSTQQVLLNHETSASFQWRMLRLGFKVLGALGQCWCGFKQSLLWGFDIALWVLLLWLCCGKQLGIHLFESRFTALSSSQAHLPAAKHVANRVASYAKYALPTSASCQKVYIRTLHRQSVRVGQTVRYLGLDIGTVQHITPMFPSPSHAQAILSVVWCRDGQYKLALPQDPRILMANMTLLGGEDLEFLPDSSPNLHRLRPEYRTSSLQKERLATQVDPLNWESFRMSEYLDLQAEGLLLTEQSLLGIESGLKTIQANLVLLERTRSQEDALAHLLEAQMQHLSTLKVWHTQLQQADETFKTFTPTVQKLTLPALLQPTQAVLRTQAPLHHPVGYSQD